MLAGSVPLDAADPHPVQWGDVPRHFVLSPALLLFAYVWLVLLDRTEWGLVWFLQEGACPGDPRAPGARAHQESRDFSARLPCAREPQWWGEQHTLRWNWCPSDHQLLLKQPWQEVNILPPPMLSPRHDPNPAPCLTPLQTQLFDCCRKRTSFLNLLPQVQKPKATDAPSHWPPARAPGEQLQPKHCLHPV